MIEIKGLCKSYGDFEALHRVDVSVAKGEFVVVLGASGAGKSTLLRCINRLAAPSGGDIRVDGKLTSDSRAGLRQLRCDVGDDLPALQRGAAPVGAEERADRPAGLHAVGAVVAADVPCRRHRHCA